MALRGAAARRYAQAIFDIATEQNTLDVWLNELKMLVSAFGSAGMVSRLEDPDLAETDQRKIIGDALQKVQVNPLAINFIYLLAQRQRLGLLPRILGAYQELYNRAKGIIIAEVITAVPLDDARRANVARQLSAITGKNVQLQLREDPRILGGVITRIGDQLIDASLASRLAQLAERLE